MSNETSINCSVIEDGVKCGNDTYSNLSCSEGPLTPSEGLFWVYLSVFLILVIVAGEKAKRNRTLVYRRAETADEGFSRHSLAREDARRLRRCNSDKSAPPVC